MNKLLQAAARTAMEFTREESGQDLIEYVLVAMLIACGAVASVKYVQTSIVNAVYHGITIVLSCF